MGSNRLIAMLDILGFKNMIANNQLLEIVNRVEHLLTTTTSELERSYSVLDEGNYKTKAGMAHFSDSIIIWSQPLDDFENSSRLMVETHFFDLVTRIMLNGFLVGLPLRVGVACGETYIDENKKIIVGQAIIDAHLVESAQNWVGGALHPNMIVNQILEYPEYLFQYILKYPVPIKQNSEMQLNYALNWAGHANFPQYRIHKKVGSVKFGDRKQLYNAFKKYEKADLPEYINIKYTNAKNFMGIAMKSMLKNCAESSRMMRRD